MTHIHDLGGCAPVPLAHYLKALGILRLVAEQADPQARGWWEGERFRLATALSREELEHFFCEQYRPTPVFNPWGGRSGYFPGSSESSARASLQRIERSKDPRLQEFRKEIATIRRVLAASDSLAAGNSPAGWLVQAIRRDTRGSGAFWIDTVVAVLSTADTERIEQPALFGTGGNEGSGGYPSAFMGAIVDCLLERKWDCGLYAALFGQARPHERRWDQSMGQFLPGASGTPWDLVLAFEGAVTVRSGVRARAGTAARRWMASPFFVAPSPCGYASKARLDEFVVNKGKELPGRGEQWFPLWPNPMLFTEVAHLFCEGRAQTRRGAASDGWSMARAVVSLGIRQGIAEFVRYGYQQRNNLATHFAVPLGRMRVPERSAPILACLDDLDSWLPRLHRVARAKEAPARLAQADRRLADALFAVVQHGGEPVRWQSVLLALAAVEGIQVAGAGYSVGPTPRLQPGWVAAADDGSHELRLALALALQQGGSDGQQRPSWNTIRRHWLPLDRRKPRQFATSGTGSQRRLQVGPEVVIGGRRGVDDAIALVGRRLTEAAQAGDRHLPLRPAIKAAASAAALAALLAGEVDIDQTLALARALMALDTRAWSREPVELPSKWEDRLPDDAWLVVRLALLPWPIKTSQGAAIQVGCDPAVFRWLSTGDAAAAVDLALRRLTAAGVRATVRTATVPPATARLWAAALAFPITTKTARTFLRRLDPSSVEKETTS